MMILLWLLVGWAKLFATMVACLVGISVAILGLLFAGICCSMILVV